MRYISWMSGTNLLSDLDRNFLRIWTVRAEFQLICLKKWFWWGSAKESSAANMNFSVYSFQTSSTFAFTASLFKFILNFSRSILFDRKKFIWRETMNVSKNKKNYSFKMDLILMLNDASLLTRITLACSILSTLAICRW